MLYCLTSVLIYYLPYCGYKLTIIVLLKRDNQNSLWICIDLKIDECSKLINRVVCLAFHFSAGFWSWKPWYYRQTKYIVSRMSSMLLYIKTLFTVFVNISILPQSSTVWSNQPSNTTYMNKNVQSGKIICNTGQKLIPEYHNCLSII